MPMRFIVGKTAHLAQQVGVVLIGGVFGPVMKVSRDCLLCLASMVASMRRKRLLGFFFGAIRHNLAGIHDRARKHCAQAGLLDRPDGFEGALRTGIEKIMLAHRRHAATNRLDAAEQAACIKMLRRQNPSAAVDPFEPWHEL